MRLYKAVKDADEGVFKCPNIKNYKRIPPIGYELTNEYFVDNSGLGDDYEPALTIEKFLHKVKAGYYYAITAEGQFQVYIGEFKKKEAKNGNK